MLVTLPTPLTAPTFREAGMADTISIDAILSGQVLLVSPEFDSKVTKGDECWEWQGPRLVRGYGRFYSGSSRKVAHREAYEFVHGPLTPGIYVCHHCDNPPCVRPDHLFAGTHTDNMRDMWAKGRGSRNGTPQPGESNPHAVLTERDVILVRRLVAVGVPQVKVAEVFEVAFGTISDIIRGRKWKHV